MLGFHIYFAYIFTDYTKADQLDTGDKTYDAGHTGPTADGMACQSSNQCPDDTNKDNMK